MIGEQHTQRDGGAGRIAQPRAGQLLEVGHGVVGRAIVDDHDLQAAPGTLADDALDAALEIHATIARQQVDRELVQIRLATQIRHIGRLRYLGELLLKRAALDQRPVARIVDGIAGGGDPIAQRVGLGVALVVAQRPPFAHERGYCPR